MSTRKTFVIDSSNRSRGDDGVFEIDIDRNYFNKIPNAIKLINANVPIDIEFINSTNNRMRIEKLDDGGKVENYLDIEFPAIKGTNVTSCLDFLNSYMQSAVQNSNLFLYKNYIYFLSVSNSSLYPGYYYSSLNNNITYPTDKVTVYIVPGFYNLPNTTLRQTLTEMKIAINFDIDYSIGPLLGFGAKRYTYVNDLHTQIKDDNKIDPIFPPYNQNDLKFFRSLNTISNNFTDRITIDNKKLEINYQNDVFLTEYNVPIANRNYVIELGSNYEIADIMKKDINSNVFVTSIRNYYVNEGITNLTGIIFDVNYTERKSYFNVSSSNVFKINFNIPNSLGNTTLGPFRYVQGNSTLTASYKNNFDGKYTGQKGYNLQHLNSSTLKPFMISSSNNSIEIDDQTFVVPTSFIINDVDNQSIINLPTTYLTSKIYTTTFDYKYTTSVINNDVILNGSGTLIFQDYTLQISDYIIINLPSDTTLNGYYRVDNNINNSWQLIKLQQYNTNGTNYYIILDVIDKRLYQGRRFQKNNNQITQIKNTDGNSAIMTPITYFSEYIQNFNNNFNTFVISRSNNSINAEISNTTNAQLIDINGVPLITGNTVLIDQNIYPSLIKYNGLYTVSVNNGLFPWRLTRLTEQSVEFISSADPTFHSNVGTLIFNDGTASNDISLEYNPSNPVIGAPLVINGDFVGVFFKVKINTNSNRAGTYICTENTGLTWKLQRLDKIYIPNNLYNSFDILYNNGVNSYNLFIAKDRNDMLNPSFKTKYITGDPGYKSYVYSSRNRMVSTLSNIVNNTTNIVNLNVSDIVKFNYYNISDIYNLSLSGLGDYTISATTTSSSSTPIIFDTFINFSLRFGNDDTGGGTFSGIYIGFLGNENKGAMSYTSDTLVPTRYDIQNSNTIIDQIKFGHYNKLLKQITISDNYNDTAYLVRDINRLFRVTGQTYVDTGAIDINYDYLTNTYTISHNLGTKFAINFDLKNSLGTILGFRNGTYQGRSSYTGEKVEPIENINKINNIYICSDLVDSVDSGSIIPLGGSVPVENVLFSIPNVLDYNETSDTEVIINNSLFVQKFKENKFNTNNKIPIKFWIKVPNGTGFIKKPWYMRTELIFKTINELV